jgi:antagonist of KipI
MSISVLRPGLLTTIQDLGRFGSQKYGVIVSGAMDSYSLRIANLLTGNKENEGALEITLTGPKLQFECDQLIAITGGDLQATIDGEKAPMWRPVLVREGSVLQFKSAQEGCRAYLAFAGGIAVPEVLGSKSTYIRAGIGGFQGRALKKGDTLTFGNMNEISCALVRKLKDTGHAFPWAANTASLINLKQNQTVRVMRGTEFDRFDDESRQTLFNQIYTVSTEADRMGYRLKGPKLSLAGKFELLSEGVTCGTIQVPASGEPIILMADRQTTGGYPKIGQVISADLPGLAQLQPMGRIQFKQVSLETAQQELLAKEQMIQEIKTSIRLKALRL